MFVKKDQLSPKHEMVDVPIRSPCCTVLMDSRNIDETRDRCKLNERGHTCRKKCIAFVAVFSIILFTILLRLAFLFLVIVEDDAIRTQPESRMGWMISSFDDDSKRVIDGDPFFSDQTKLTNEITRTVEYVADAFPTKNGGEMRFKREISRARRDCEMSAERCGKLVQTMESYLATLKSNAPSDGNPVSVSDILNCLRCKNLQSAIAKKLNEDSTPRTRDEYLSHDYVAQNRSNDFGISAIKLLEDAKRAEINRTEAAKGQVRVMDSLINDVSRNSVDQLKDNISQTTAASNDRINYSSRQIDNPTTIDSRMMRIDENSLSTVPSTEQQIESEGTTSEMIMLFNRTESSSATQYTITKDDAVSKGEIDHSTEASTQYSVNLTKQIAIAENVTSMPAGHDVTGIDNRDDSTVHPSMQPSFGGHPENQSTTKINVSGSSGDQSVLNKLKSDDRSQIENSNEPIQTTMESTKPSQQLQMLYPVCIFDYSVSQSSAFTFYPNSSDPSATQNRELPFQKPLHQGAPSSNYMQLQANPMQFIPEFGYAGNQRQAQPAGQSTDLTRSDPSNVSPMTRKPYFCGYMSLPTLHFPSISNTLQSDRFFANKMKDSSPEETFPKAGTAAWEYSTYECPRNYYQCDNLFCIPETNRCDGHANCFDVSDEMNCSCRDRILQSQICDGYFDCPHGEDELGCFDCPADSFSCNYNSNKPLHNCVPLSQRCDGIKQCSNGKDELDCTILSESYISPKDISTVGYTQGYLHKNIQGQWYPVCSVTASWAINACISEMDQPLTAMPDMRIVQVPKNTFRDPYVTEANGQIKLTSCSGVAIYVKCPPLPCGIKNHYDSFRAANATRNDYVSKKETKEQYVSHKFDKLYQQTLGLLNANRSAFEKNERDENDTLVGAQLRVVGGRASQPRAWPFLVAIYKDGHFHCGGTILSEIYVLTASHCMEGYERHYFEVQAGTLRRFSFSPMTQLRKAKLVILHPDYENKNMQNDISIIMLDKPFLFNRWVRQVCLPSQSIIGPEWKLKPFPQSMCIAIGWGALKEDGSNSDHLREVEVPILPKCNHLSDQNDATICAGYPEGGQDTCQGDSGGPLMCRTRNFDTQWYVAGLVSHGDGCARPNEPGVYMKISYFVDWIQQVSDTLSNHTDSFYKDRRPLLNCPTFRCDDGKCLPMEERCNEVIDCLNGEDELQCNPFEVSSPNLNMNNGKNKQSDSDNKVGQSQDETPDDTIKHLGLTEISTEAIPIFTSHRFFYETQNVDEDSNTTIMPDYAIMPETTSVKLTFTCKRFIQTITINKRCDRHVDCEDATDEKDCTCRDYLLNMQPMAICDGHLDCNDETDEKDCGICGNDEFYCSRSEGCISITKRCDGEFDCPLSEDELDCLVLTDGEYVNVHSYDQPVLNMEGLLSKHNNGEWHVQCLEADILDNNTIMSIIGRNLCEYLGFANLQSMDKVVANKTVLKKRFWRSWENITSYEPSPEHVATSEEDETCTTLRIRCRPVLSSSVDTHLIVNPKSGSQYLWPWLAAIFVDGQYRCSALLLESDWLLSSSSCTNDIKLSVNYTTALLGQSRSYLYVDGPHQQISVVDEIKNVKTSEVSLLHLKTAVNLTRYTQPLFLEKKIYPPAKNDTCVAVGTDKEHVTKSIFLRPVLENCDNCYRCFVEASGFECPVNETLDWSGTVFCRSEKGWYPAAVFHENDFCNFRNKRNLTSIDYIHAFLIHTLETEPKPTPEPTCDGVRCNIGQCIPWNQVCDDVMNCRDGADEKDEMCMHKVQRNSGSNKPKKCAKSELRCKNGECISKSAFCDAKVDCSDGTDEPISCTCADYLSLTTPERLCDGVRHCLDKTDESPEMCQCTQTSFKCNAESNNVTCISQDFVCDGDEDCPNGEDEEECIKIEESTDNRPGTGEVKIRSFGVWHSKCFSSSVTSQEEAKIVCQMLGYEDGKIDSKNQTLNEPVIPSHDFYMIRLNPHTWITMRGDKSFITLIRPEESCYRLFVTCN